MGNQDQPLVPAHDVQLAQADVFLKSFEAWFEGRPDPATTRPGAAKQPKLEPATSYTLNRRSIQTSGPEFRRSTIRVDERSEAAPCTQNKVADLAADQGAGSRFKSVSISLAMSETSGYTQTIFLMFHLIARDRWPPFKRRKRQREVQDRWF